MRDWKVFALNMDLILLKFDKKNISFFTEGVYLFVKIIVLDLLQTLVTSNKNIEESKGLNKSIKRILKWLKIFHDKDSFIKILDVLDEEQWFTIKSIY